MRRRLFSNTKPDYQEGSLLIAITAVWCCPSALATWQTCSGPFTMSNYCAYSRCNNDCSGLQNSTSMRKKVL